MNEPIEKKKLEIGAEYLIGFTHPMYDKTRQTYLPDNFRFIDPTVRRVRFGGKCPEKRYCKICGRPGQQSYQFLDMEKLTEIFISRHCMDHESTTVWKPDEKQSTIDHWYEIKDFHYRLEAGDPLAGLVHALGGDPEYMGEEL